MILDSWKVPYHYNTSHSFSNNGSLTKKSKQVFTSAIFVFSFHKIYINESSVVFKHKHHTCRCCSGLWCCVDSLVDTTVLEKHTVSIMRHEDGDIMFLEMLDLPASPQGMTTQNNIFTTTETLNLTIITHISQLYIGHLCWSWFETLHDHCVSAAYVTYLYKLVISWFPVALIYSMPYEE